MKMAGKNTFEHPSETSGVGVDGTLTVKIGAVSEKPVL